MCKLAPCTHLIGRRFHCHSTVTGPLVVFGNGCSDHFQRGRSGSKFDWKFFSNLCVALPFFLKWKRDSKKLSRFTWETWSRHPRRMDEFVTKTALLLTRCCWLSNNWSYLGHKRWRAEGLTLALIANPSGRLNNWTVPTRERKKRAAQMKPFILHICVPVADAKI